MISKPRRSVEGNLSRVMQRLGFYEEMFFLREVQSKGSSDKRGWSFRKRSARHRVLSNTVITETPYSGNKESPESAANNFQTSSDSTVPEKISVLQWTDEKAQLSTSKNLNVTETIVATENENKVDVNVEESVAIAIQAAIRGILAQRSLLKLKNVVKLQAAVRGHLVRRHAVGTLRCVQAIIKMQALVRARRARLSLERAYKERDNNSSNPLEKEVSMTKTNVPYTSIEKLLSNKFACQLLESTSKTKSIQIKCDSSRPNSGWKWLERWMSVSSSDVSQSQKPDLSTEQKGQEELENSPSQIETEIPSEVCESADLKSGIKETELPSESEDNLITYDAENFDFHACHPTSYSLRDKLEEPSENTGTFNAKGTQSEIDSVPDETMQSDAKVPDANVQVEHSKPEMKSEQPKGSMEMFASEQLETEGKKIVFGSRKASNPAFISAQSKFEELSLTANSNRSISSTHQDVGVNSNVDTVSSGDSVNRTKEFSLGENLVPHNPRVQVGGSECGTELSISSTLDSPDRYEVGAMEFEHEAKGPKEEACNPDSGKNLDVEAKDVSTIPVSNLSDSVSVQTENVDDVIVESVNAVVAADSPQFEQKPERSESDMQTVLDTEASRQAYRSSPEASPRSHITVPESQGTPSSQVSVKPKRSKTDKSGSKQKHKSLSAGKSSPSNPNHDSGARSSVEQLPKDQKVGKRRNSFGSVRTDNVDQERRDSNSNNSLPSYMQATESARAKAHANNSPRSSPDLQEKDIYIKKRHSLPGANGKQGSPRIQQSMSKAQQVAKGNGTNSPHERKWQR
ncbi:hypothetical protein L1049_026486 [Liquidambar formosana]|uniref:DUF4005 domain-containing protein n=1 Tax=Liquidambar formosana TaxID=63359 RepID=A0AAP0R6G9_LIQFO